ncbi:hypothetical protein PHLCEN_2v5174 [Hermanssonia centrifuga]|uniref:Uncharacterized protein n=1 Tax=Hermanssonia centrifuga TaxID=98765 RepID=A0A2R6P8X7_9APHY|nr:hypothetical protein PHLCEN_2v5174 [Hermanssonia centrifuga]
MTKLSTGNYIITNRRDDQTLAIGRNFVEDKSLLPKKVVSLPPSAEAPVVRQNILCSVK